MDLQGYFPLRMFLDILDDQRKHGLFLRPFGLQKKLAVVAHFVGELFRPRKIALIVYYYLEFIREPGRFRDSAL
jgi:hypothetical protein